MNKMSYFEAIYDALNIKLRKDQDVFIYGQGVDDHKGHYGTTLIFISLVLKVLIHLFVS